MKGIERLRAIERSTDPLNKALPLLPAAETTLIRLIRVGAFGLDDYFMQVFRDWNLTEKHYHVLCVLMATQKGGAYPSELSELIGTSRANMTKVLTSLEAEAYVRRESTKKDGRRSMVLITKKGREIVNTLTPLMVDPIVGAFSGLSETEITTLDMLLRKLIVSFDEAKQSHSSLL